MREVFADLPEACDNTLAIAQRCAYMPEPRKPILPSYTKLDGRTEGEAGRNTVWISGAMAPFMPAICIS